MKRRRIPFETASQFELFAWEVSLDLNCLSQTIFLERIKLQTSPKVIYEGDEAVCSIIR